MHARGVPARRAVPAADGRGVVERPARVRAERVGAEAAGAARLPRDADARFESRRRAPPPAPRPRAGVPIPLRRRRHARGARATPRDVPGATTVHVRPDVLATVQSVRREMEALESESTTDGGDASSPADVCRTHELCVRSGADAWVVGKRATAGAGGGTGKRTQGRVAVGGVGSSRGHASGRIRGD